MWKVKLIVNYGCNVKSCLLIMPMLLYNLNLTTTKLGTMKESRGNMLQMIMILIHFNPFLMHMLSKYG